MRKMFYCQSAEIMEKPPSIDFAKNNNYLHVFFVNNPIVKVLTRLIVASYGLNPSDVLCVMVRGTDTKLIPYESVEMLDSMVNRVSMKLFASSLSGIAIRRQLERRNRKFLVYASWMYAEIEKVVESKLCLGHIYLEEGQQTYYLSKSYTPNKSNNWKTRKENIQRGDINYYFRSDAVAYISLTKESFPLVDKRKVFLLNNIGSLTKEYKGSLKGVFNIGVFPAPRRIPRENLIDAVELFFNAMGSGAVKLHPGFEADKKMKHYVCDLFRDHTENRLYVCHEDVILELEMLTESKCFYGTRSSVSRYAEIFGSKYVFLEFKNYQVPLN